MYYKTIINKLSEYGVQVKNNITGWYIKHDGLEDWHRIGKDKKGLKPILAYCDYCKENNIPLGQRKNI